jgi:hypothetical protein
MTGLSAIALVDFSFSDYRLAPLEKVIFEDSSMELVEEIRG